MTEQSNGENLCQISSILPVDGGAELTYTNCDEESVAWAVRLALESEGFSLADGSEKHGVFKSNQDNGFTRLTSDKIALKLDIASRGKTVIARILDVTPELDDKFKKRIHLRNIRRIIAYLRKIVLS